MGRAQSNTRNLGEGTCLYCADWWLIPYTREAASALRRARQFLRRGKRFKVRPSPDPRRPNEIFREIKRLDREIHKANADFYNAQPNWSLSDIQIGSSSDAPQVVDEFLRLADFTAAEYCWTMNRPVRGMDWKQHAWKHTTFAEIEAIIADVNAKRWLPPELAVDQLGSLEEAQILFRRAERGEPDAVARIDSVLPSQADKIAAARHVFELGDDDAAPPIPSVRQLAANLAEIAIRAPDSPQAERARLDSRALLSIQAAKGSRPQGGRPPSPHHEETVRTIWMMSYAMSRQLREIDDFLQKSEPDEHKRRAQIEQRYPWLSILHIDCVEFLKLGNTQSALELAGKLLGISPSKVAKIVHSPRSAS